MFKVVYMVILLNLLVGCKPAGQDVSTILADDSESLKISLSQKKLITVNVGQRSIDGIKTIETKSTNSGDTASLTYTRIELTVDGYTCFANFTDSTENPPVVCPEQQAGSTPTAADFSQKISIHPEMICGLHEGDKKWQVKFWVSLEARAAMLEQVERVEYDVYHSYANGKPFAGTALETNFRTAVGFLTPVSNWSTGPATVQLKSGNSLEIPSGRIIWTNPTPETTPTGQPCGG